jgi:CBS domain-containing protein
MTTTTTPRVGNLMTVDPVVVDAEAPVTKAELLLKSYRISGLPVVADGALVGVISQTDLLNARSSELIGANWDRVRVRHLMSRPAVTVHMNTSVERAARVMLEQHIHRVVVVDEDDVPIGVLTSTDLLRTLLPVTRRPLHRCFIGPSRVRHAPDLHSSACSSTSDASPACPIRPRSSPAGRRRSPPRSATTSTDSP